MDFDSVALVKLTPTANQQFAVRVPRTVMPGDAVGFLKETVDPENCWFTACDSVIGVVQTVFSDELAETVAAAMTVGGKLPAASAFWTKQIPNEKTDGE